MTELQVFMIIFCQGEPSPNQPYPLMSYHPVPTTDTTSMDMTSVDKPDLLMATPGGVYAVVGKIE